MPKEFPQLDWSPAIEADLRQVVQLAVREDVGSGQDWTTLALIGPDVRGRAAVVVREAGVVAGLRAAPIVIDEMRADVRWHTQTADGDEVAAGSTVAVLVGRARDMLTVERPLLNLLGRLSGIATLTRQYVRAVEGTGARVYDTRKTTPGWRRLEKYAVRCGGGMNHRTGLFDAVLIKDNHLALAAADGMSPAEAVRRARQSVRQSVPGYDPERFIIEVEVDSREQLNDVLSAGPDIVLLDNMTPARLHEAVARRDTIAPDVELEASGDVTLENVRAAAQSGVDRISVGALTHSARSLGLGLDWLSSSDR